jgi:hypothetical protein
MTPNDTLRLAILQYHKDTKLPLPPVLSKALRWLDAAAKQ